MFGLTVLGLRNCSSVGLGIVKGGVSASPDRQFQLLSHERMFVCVVERFHGRYQGFGVKAGLRKNHLVCVLGHIEGETDTN